MLEPSLVAAERKLDPPVLLSVLSSLEEVGRFSSISLPATDLVGLAITSLGKGITDS